MAIETMARAEKVACAPRDSRCLPLPDRVEDALVNCTPKSRCKIGWIPADAGRKAWEVWLDIHSAHG
jgi:hypothetical protein